ncbi:MAG TPA: hypothetical protein VFV87_16850, partial [Pirellulaceae bacterium]|nr:hypothetical protein [Pirellulaceae bacterium]
VALALLIVVTILNSITGYLGPTTAEQFNDSFDEETFHRFIVLHMVFLPTFFVALLAVWAWWFRPTRSPVVESRR